jgi:anti-sigma B factor antagonist
MSPTVGSSARVVSRSGTTATVAVSGEIDIANASQFRACLTGCLTDGCADIIIDMQDLTFMDASGVSVLAEVSQLAEAGGGHLTVQKPPPIVRKILHITGLATIIQVTDRDSHLEPPGA